MRIKSFLACAVLVVLTTMACLGTTSAEFSKVTEVPDNVISFGYWEEPPCIYHICPRIGFSGCCACLMVFGDNFDEDALVELVRGEDVIPACFTWVICSGSILCKFDLRGAQSGLWDVRVTNPDGGSYSLHKGFLVLGCWRMGQEGDVDGPGNMVNPSPENPVPAPQRDNAPPEEIVPEVPGLEPVHPPEPPPQAPEQPQPEQEPTHEEELDLSFSPRSGRAGEWIELVISGYSFVPGTVVILEDGWCKIMCLSTTVEDGKLKAQLNLKAARPGEWRIKLKQPNGKVLALKGVFTISR